MQRGGPAVRPLTSESVMGTTNDVDSTVLASCQDYAEKALGRLKENFELLLGQGVKLEVESLAAERDDELRKRLPSDAIALAVEVPDKDASIGLFFLDPPLAHVMLALMRVAPGEEVQRLWSEGSTELAEEDLESLRETAGFLAASLTDELRARIRKCEMAFEPRPPRVLVKNAWQEGVDPMGAAPYLVADARFTLGSKDDVPCVFALPLPLMTELVSDFRGVQMSEMEDKEAARDEPATARDEPAPVGEERHGKPVDNAPGPPPPQARSTPARPTPAPQVAPEVAASSVPGLVLFLGRSELAAAIGERFGESLVRIEKLSQVVAQLEQHAPPDLVFVEVATGEEHLLPIVGSLARQPGMKGRAVVVLLDEPTRSTVLRCAHLGLWNVLPSAEETEIIAARSQALLQAS